MKTKNTKTCIFVIVLLIFFSSSTTYAQNSSIYFLLSVDEQGLDLEYDLPLIGQENVSIGSQSGAVTMKLFSGLVFLNLQFDQANIEQSNILLTYGLTVPFVGYLGEKSISIPFMSFGFDLDLSGKDIQQITGDNDIAIAISYSNENFSYNIDLNLLSSIIVSWSGKADIENSAIYETANIDLSPLPDTNNNWPESVEFDLKLLPVFTAGKIGLVGVGFQIYNSEGNTLFAIPDFIPILGDLIGLLPYPIMKGNYRIWFDFE